MFIWDILKWKSQECSMNITKNYFQSILVVVRKFDLVLFLSESVWSIVWYFCLVHFSWGLFWTIARLSYSRAI